MSRSFILVCFVFTTPLITQSESKWKGKKVLNCQSYSVPVYQVSCSSNAPVFLCATPCLSAYEYDIPLTPSPDVIYYPEQYDSISPIMLHKTYKVKEDTDENYDAKDKTNIVYTFNEKEMPESKTSGDSNKYDSGGVAYYDVSNKGPIQFEKLNDTGTDDLENYKYTEVTYYDNSNRMPIQFVKVNNTMSDYGEYYPNKAVTFYNVSNKGPIQFEKVNNTSSDDGDNYKYRELTYDVTNKGPIQFVNTLPDYEQNAKYNEMPVYDVYNKGPVQIGFNNEMSDDNEDPLYPTKDKRVQININIQITSI